MANKRQLKKNIHTICGDVAAECAMATGFIEGVDESVLAKAVVDVFKLQQASLSRSNVNFDKVPSDFGNRHAYNLAKSRFYASAMTSLREEFNKRLQEIVKDMNTALPKK